jgi:hypothetical protein
MLMCKSDAAVGGCVGVDVGRLDASVGAWVGGAVGSRLEDSDDGAAVGTRVDPAVGGSDGL